MNAQRMVTVRRQNEPPAETGRLWFGLIAAPAAWMAQELLGWFFGERICESMSIGTVRLVVLLISVGALALAAAGGSVGWRSWRASAELPDPIETDASGRVEFMALGGVLVSSVFALAIVWAGLSSAFVNACGRVR